MHALTMTKGEASMMLEGLLMKLKGTGLAKTPLFLPPLTTINFYLFPNHVLPEFSTPHPSYN